MPETKPDPRNDPPETPTGESFDTQPSEAAASLRDDHWEARLDPPAPLAPSQPAGPETPPPGIAGSAWLGTGEKGQVRDVGMVPAARIQPSPITARKRLNLEELQSLGRSIRTHGMLQPLLVRRRDEDGYDLIAGYRRWLAASLEEIEEVPAVVIEQVDDVQALELALIENLHRRDLTVIEEAEAHRTLIEKFERTHQDVADLIGRSRSYVTNGIRLLSLPEEVRAMIESGALSASHARALLGAERPAELARTVVTQQLTVRDAERLVMESRQEMADDGSAEDGADGAPARQPGQPETTEWPTGADHKPAPVLDAAAAGPQTDDDSIETPPDDESIAELEREIAEFLGVEVEIVQDGPLSRITMVADDELEILWVAQRIKSALQSQSLAEAISREAAGPDGLVA